MKKNTETFFFLPDFDEKKLESIHLKLNSPVLLADKINELNECLNSGLSDFSHMDFSSAAKNFRKIAQELNLLENLCSTEGKYHFGNTLNDLTGKQWLRHTKSWLIVDGKREEMTHEIRNHPASYPPSLASYFIEFFTKKGQWVFDPFIGIGSTAEACFLTRRNCFGIELNPEYLEFAKKRIGTSFKPLNKTQKESKEDEVLKDLQFKLFQGDARNALEIWKNEKLPELDFLITSPPYWNILHTKRGGVKSTLKKRVEAGLDETYSQLENDLGNIPDYQSYLEQIKGIFACFKTILKPKAYIMVILQNVRPKDGVMVPVAWDVADKLKEIYSLRQEFVWCQDQKFLGIWGYPKTYVSNVHHHYCLVFQKDNKKE